MQKPHKSVPSKAPNKPQIFGDIRVSSKEQNEARQLDALAGFAVPRGNIYIGKQSGKDFDRPNYKKLGAPPAPRRCAGGFEHRPAGAQL